MDSLLEKARAISAWVSTKVGELQGSVLHLAASHLNLGMAKLHAGEP